MARPSAHSLRSYAGGTTGSPGSLDGTVAAGLLASGSGLIRAVDFDARPARRPGALAGALPRADELHRGDSTVEEVAATLARAEVAAAQLEGEPVAVIRTESGRVYVLPDRCPHDGGPISDGFVEGEQVVCARHGWKIEACSGRCPRAGDADIAGVPAKALAAPANALAGAYRPSAGSSPGSLPGSSFAAAPAAAPLIPLLPPRLRLASASQPPPGAYSSRVGPAEASDS